jgi:hypothetical protein
LQLWAPSPAAKLIERQVMGDAIEPAADRATRVIEGMGMLPRAEEGLLQNLLGGVSITDDPQQQREDDPGMAIVERSERLDFAGSERSDQPDIRHIVVR